MALFLTIHTRYHEVEIGLFNDRNCLEQLQEQNKKISKNFIFILQDLLTRHQITLEDLNFIAANRGPAPFTTLRVVLASINGLSFATHIPLVGVDSLQVLVQEYRSHQCSYIIGLLNAFSHDIYYALLEQRTGAWQVGYQAIEVFARTMAATIQQESVLFIGNGVDLYKQIILSHGIAQAQFLENNPEVASLDAIARRGLEIWQTEKKKEFELQPLYLKAHAATLSGK